MNFLSLFVLIPVLMLGGLLLASDIKQIRAVCATGASLLLLLAVALTVLFLGERNSGNTAEMLCTASSVWYAPFHIHYSVGVDGISVAMLLLSSIIVFTGIFTSWKMELLPREYFMWFCLLSIGVFGFFISTDLFTMFMFYEIALIPMYLLIGVWGTGKKEYAAMKLTLMLMGGSALLLVGILGILTGISVVYGAYSAIVQTDLKYINAYSSVSHCGLVLFAILMLNQTAVTGAIMQMLSHGLMTALFFALIGMIYGRTHTRDIREMGGLMKIIPFLGACYVIAGLASLGLPGLSGFVAEMTIFVGSFQHADVFHRVMTILACTSIVITAVYILRVVGKLLYGKVVDEHHLQLTDAVWYERFSAIVLILAIAGIGLAPLWISDMIRESLNGLWPF